jgi:hypothetical protein
MGIVDLRFGCAFLPSVAKQWSAVSMSISHRARQASTRKMHTNNAHGKRTRKARPNRPLLRCLFNHPHNYLVVYLKSTRYLNSERVRDVRQRGRHVQQVVEHDQVVACNARSKNMRGRAGLKILYSSCSCPDRTSIFF